MSAPRICTEKILTRAEAKERLARERRGDKTLALANGCFDILHVGHVRYLKAAKGEADILLVAINSDESVRKLKGQGRPVQPEQDRAEIVAALGCVDFAVLFEEDTVAPLISELKPDVQCKGTDYTALTVPEREAMLKVNGRVAIVGDPKGHDSSGVLARLRS